MKTNRLETASVIAVFLLAGFCFDAVAAEKTSENNARLRSALAEHPLADADGDGVLTLSEAMAFLRAQREKEEPNRQSRAAGPARDRAKPVDLTAIEKTDKGLWVASTGHSLVAPALGPFGAIAKRAGYDGHLQVRQLSGGATGSPRSHWEKPEEKQAVKRALATGKCDVLTMGSHPEGSEVEDFARWIDLGLKHNPEMVFYIQEVWPRLTDLLEGGGKGSTNPKVTLEKYEEQIQGLNDWIAVRIKALDEKYPGKVRVIPVGNGMAELVRRHLDGKLPGVDTIYVPKEAKDDPRVGLYRDWIHPTPIVATLEGYIYFACLYKKNPADLPSGLLENRELDKLLREVAWQVVQEHPFGGVKTDR